MNIVTDWGFTDGEITTYTDYRVCIANGLKITATQRVFYRQDESQHTHTHTESHIHTPTHAHIWRHTTESCLGSPAALASHLLHCYGANELLANLSILELIS